MSNFGAQARYPRGSEWRKWDLQVHTPFSALNNGFGPNFQDYAKKLLTAAVENEIAVVGITDYFCIEGYKQLKGLLDDAAALEKLVGAEIAEKSKSILFLANVELRTTILYSDKGKDSRVNFHVVFSDKVSVHDIEENFLRELKFTAESDPDNEDERWSLTLPNLETLGKKLQAEHEPFRKDSVLFTGMMNAVLHHENITAALTARATLFKDNFVFCLPCDEDLSNFKWNGQGHLMRKLLVQKSHVLFSSNANTREFALGKKHLSSADYVEEFKGFKPCFHGSDAHTYAELFTPKGGRHTWIKADPTFHGLRQTLNEPEDRVFIGEVPPSVARVHNRATRIISSLNVKKLETSKLTEIWFNSDIPLNPELVAVIGNKGAGKSALSDIIGLLGNTPRHDSFSFLQTEKFRSARNNKARHFTASITWADSTMDKCDSLDANPPTDAVEKVKYIPQSYLEEICNEVGKGKGSRFYAELEQVIFSHVPEADKGGFGTLDGLLSHRGEETTLAIGFLIEELKHVNAEIIACDVRLSPHHKATVEAQLAEKKRELESHTQNRPTEVNKPEEDPTVQQQAKNASQALEIAKAELEAVEKLLAETRAKDVALGKRKLAAEKLLAKLDNYQRQATAFLSDTKREFEELGLKQNDLITVNVNTNPLTTLIHDLNGQRASIAASLDSKTSGSPEQKRAAISAQIEALQTQLSAPQQKYQAYLQALKEWETVRKTIIGDGTVTGSIAELEAQLAALKLLPAEMRNLKRRQQRKALEIFCEKKKLRGYYASYYGEVQKFLAEHPLGAGGQFRLTFDVTITQTDFASAFLNRINRRKTGPFMGEEEGASELKRLLDATNFDSAYGTLRFIRTLITILNGEPGRKLDPAEQLRGGFTLQELYDYIFSLEYLSPIYNLRWDAKTLEQLSPGERGNLLLIFYLLVDRDDLPLVIDQPEENLDNQTVFKTLVPCIKDAKKRRQIIIVTHNPNLAVVCDAEQIICAEIHKDQGNEVNYLPGSIENPAINQKIVDILEGTRPAFDKRDDKYQP